MGSRSGRCPVRADYLAVRGEMSESVTLSINVDVPCIGHFALPGFATSL